MPHRFPRQDRARPAFQAAIHGIVHDLGNSFEISCLFAHRFPLAIASLTGTESGENLLHESLKIPQKCRGMPLR
jgi:hypothetical protein